MNSVEAEIYLKEVEAEQRTTVASQVVPFVVHAVADLKQTVETVYGSHENWVAETQTLLVHQLVVRYAVEERK